jgi:hypothetical protein
MTYISDFVKTNRARLSAAHLAGVRQGCFIVMAALDAAIHAGR